MINWLKKLWNWLKRLFNGSCETIESDNTLPKPSLSDAEYENVLFALLAAIKKGRSWGSCQGFLISRKVESDELAEWIEKKSEKWLENRDNYQELGQDLGELGNIASGKLGNIARNVSSVLGNFQENNLQNTQLNPTPSETQNLIPSETTTDEIQRLIDQSIQQQLKLILEDKKSSTYLAWTNDVKQNKIQQLQTLINQPEQTNESSSELYREIGRLYLANNNLDQALEFFRIAIECNPQNAKAWWNRGYILSNLARLNEAIDNYDKALEIQPDFYEAYFNLGIALYDLGKFDEAIASYDEALEIKSDFHQALYNKGIALRNLGRFEEAIDNHNKGLEIQPDFHQGWYNGGTILCDNLGKYKEAISFFNKSLEFQPDDHDAWYSRGIALLKSGRFEEAILSFDKALEFKPDDHDAWDSRGIAASRSTASEGEISRLQNQFIERLQFELTDASRQLINYFQSLETGDFRNLISFLQQPNSEKLIQFLYQSQLQSISRLNPELNKRGYEGQLISYRYPLNKHIYQDNHPEEWGFLHHKIGVAQYEHQEYDNAIESYYCALETLTVEQFPELRLAVIQDLVKVYLAVGDEDNADNYLLEGLKILNELVDKVPIEDENQRLRLEAKYLMFRQLTVNVLLEKGEIIEALRNAELEKNRRLTHILEGYKPENQLQTDSNLYPSYEQIQTLFNGVRSQGIVYWFNSPMGLITFIIKQGLQQPIYKLNYSTSQGNSTIEQWIKVWDEDYQDYRSKKDTETEDKKEHSWRLNISDRLETLKEILGIAEIEKELQDVDELILIPHQDLHRLPLHSLFTQKDWIISYLPSLQIGLKLKQKQQQLNDNQTESLLSIENPRKDLVFSEIESAIVNTYFATIKPYIITIEDFLNAIPNHTHLHFTGHGYYNFDDPKRSALEFENRSQLTAYEISHLNFNSYQLITLAACETALNGKQTIDSEYVGLVSAFLKGGANCVLSTLWTVDETSSAWLMIYFYQQYRAGITPKIALRNAQEWLKDVTNQKLVIWLNKLLEDKKNTRIN
ncbi:MAG: tetratricopeptide repeat protein, partial [Crocosphaera sp.]|nr:tetratricopeptide repeat protein [Crocosphaera sp.]